MAEVTQEELLAIELLRDVERRLGIEHTEPAWRDPDHLGRALVDGEGLSEHPGIAAEPTLPVAVIEHRGQRRPGPVIGGGEPAADRRLHAQCFEESVGDP